MISKELINIYNKYGPLLDKGDISIIDNVNDCFIVYRHARNIHNLSIYKDYDIDSLGFINTFCYKVYRLLVDLDIINEYHKKYDAVKKRIKRYNKCIEYLVNQYKYCYFITLTFSDEYIEYSDYNHVKKYLKDNLSHYKYLFNVDYGSLNDRIHYHGLVFSNDNINFKWDYGFVNFQYVSKYSNAIIKYISKFSYHAFKIVGYRTIQNINFNSILGVINE